MKRGRNGCHGGTTRLLSPESFFASRFFHPPPPDLEHYLGPHCQRLIVKYKPLSGAHLLFPKERLAVRVYYQGDLAAFQQPPQQSQHAGTQGAEADAREVPISNDDFDNLVAFLKAFETAVVLFVLNPEQQMQQLDDFASPLHRAQRLVQRLSLKPNSVRQIS